MNEEQIKILSKALAVVSIEAPEEVVALTMELSQLVKAKGLEIGLSEIMTITNKVKQNYTKKGMNTEYRFLGELEELASIKQVRQAIDKRKSKILKELGL